MKVMNNKKLLIISGVCVLFMSFAVPQQVRAEEKIPDIRTTEETFDLVQVSEDEETEPSGSDDKIHFISIAKNNDAILLESNGRFAMIDSGESYVENDRVGCAPQVIHYLQSQGVETLDFYLGTHAHNDHISNADEILHTFPTSKVYLGVYDDAYISEPGCLWDNQKCYNNLVKAAHDTGAELIQDFSEKNDTFQFGDFTIRIFNYERKYDRKGNRVTVWDDNVNSLIVTVTLGENSAMLTADALSPEIALAASEVKHVSVYKLAHHGDYKNNRISTIDQLNPSALVVTGARENTYSSIEFRDYIASSGRELFTTVSDSASIVAEFPQDGVSDVITGYRKMDIDNFYQIGNKMYCFDENGRVLQNLQNIDGALYYFEEKTGKMRYGFQTVGPNKMFFDKTTGAALMSTWYKDSNGKSYYFDANGACIRNKWETIEGTKYYFDQAGVWIPNAKVQAWVKDSVGWWYRNYDGSYPKNAWKYIGNKWYYFDKRGYMVTGWKTINSKRYYMEASGAMKTGWLKYSGKWYLLDSSGAMRTGWAKVGKSWYYMNSAGVMQTGKIVVGNTTYYLKSSGEWIEPTTTAKTGWVKDSVGYWYRNANGTWPKSCWKKIDGYWYYFNSKGYRCTGWLSRPEGKYFLNTDGKMQVNWVKYEGNYYYMNGSGVMQTGMLTWSGAHYYLDPATGIMQIGWFNCNGATIYANSIGMILEKSGWNRIGENWYYLDEKTYGRVTGWVIFNKGKDNESRYYMDENGVMVIGRYVMDDCEYYFNSAGRLISSTPIMENQETESQEMEVQETELPNMGSQESGE